MLAGDRRWSLRVARQLCGHVHHILCDRSPQLPGKRSQFCRNAVRHHQSSSTTIFAACCAAADFTRPACATAVIPEHSARRSLCGPSYASWCSLSVISEHFCSLWVYCSSDCRSCCDTYGSVTGTAACCTITTVVCYTAACSALTAAAAPPPLHASRHHQCMHHTTTNACCTSIAACRTLIAACSVLTKMTLCCRVLQCRGDLAVHHPPDPLEAKALKLNGRMLYLGATACLGALGVICFNEQTYQLGKEHALNSTLTKCHL